MNKLEFMGNGLGIGDVWASKYRSSITHKSLIDVQGLDYVRQPTYS